MKRVAVVGGLTEFREPLVDRLRSDGWDIVGPDESTDVVVQTCSTDDDWASLSAAARTGRLGRVAVIDRLDAEQYRRALSDGAGVVHVDSSPEIIVQVIESALHGEALVPMHVARHLASESPQARGVEALDALERALLRGIADGETIAELGERFHYSDRTIRRRLQSTYFKLGVDDRGAAIRMVIDDDLLDDA